MDLPKLITGTVLDEAGSPMASVLVRMSTWAAPLNAVSSAPGFPLWPVKTDERGVFRFKVTEEMAKELRRDRAKLWATAESTSSLQRVLDARADFIDGLDQTLWLRPTVTIAATVLLDAVSPAVGAQVGAMFAARAPARSTDDIYYYSGRTGQDGRVVFAGVPSEVAVVAELRVKLPGSTGEFVSNPPLRRTSEHSLECEVHVQP